MPDPNEAPNPSEASGPITLGVGPPTATEFLDLRSAVGWPIAPPPVVAKALEGSLYTVCLRRQGRLVGLGRIVGDGVLCFYVSDLLVHPDVQGLGLGDRLMGALVAYIEEHAADGASVALICTPGRAAFYERHGFTRCPNAYFAEGMVYLPPVRRILEG